MRHMRQLQSVQPLLHRFMRLVTRIAPAGLQAEADILRHTQMWKQRIILKHQPCTARLHRQIGVRIKPGFAADADMAAIGLEQAAQKLHGEAFARARSAHQRQPLRLARQLHIQRKLRQLFMDGNIKQHLYLPSRARANRPTASKITMHTIEISSTN